MPKGIKCTFGGYTFDSVPERDRAIYLTTLANDGVISNLVLDKAQLSIMLQPSLTIAATPFYKKHVIRALTYTPDYSYVYGYTYNDVYNDYLIYEDWKSLRKVKDKKTKIVKEVVHIEPASRIRIKLLQGQIQFENRTNLMQKIFRICYQTTALPDASEGYWYK